MEVFLEILKDSCLDTLKLVPFLFLVYFLIELLEYKNVFKFEKSNLLKGKASPALGACFGCVPQCGFSVVSSELFSEQKISMAALVAVFLATSDEAFPLMLSNYHYIPSLLMMIAVKLIFAISVGYLTYFLSKKIFKNTDKNSNKNIALDDSKVFTTKQSKTEQNKENNINLHNIENNSHDNHKSDDHDESEHHEHIHACCHHDIGDNKFNWKHPLIHCAKISLYIFLVNLVMGGIVAAIGEENLLKFLSSSSAFQPLFAVLVGLIPNCAASVVLTELYMLGGLSFGAIIAGLSVNAGIGILVLFKQNKNIKENLFILAMLIIPSLILGYALHFVPFGFLMV